MTNYAMSLIPFAGIAAAITGAAVVADTPPEAVGGLNISYIVLAFLGALSAAVGALWNRVEKNGAECAEDRRKLWSIIAKLAKVEHLSTDEFPCHAESDK